MTAWAYWLSLSSRLQDRTAPLAAAEFNESVRQAVTAIDARGDDPGVIAIARAVRLTAEESHWQAAVLWRQIIEDGTFADSLKRLAKAVVEQRRRAAEQRSRVKQTDKVSRSSSYLQETATSVRRSLSKSGKPLSKTHFMSEMIAALGSQRKAFEKGETVNWPWVNAEGRSQPCPRSALFDFVEGLFPRESSPAPALEQS
ncbi:MAG TPA: hypothetical protein VME21_06180 [Steroidobacteraceae bacterium]|nr:hypothetical protein [Steroidobacteraceae bacterium]